MPLTAILTPQTTLPDGHICKFSHGFNPVYVDLQRKDMTIFNISAYTANKMALIISDNSIFTVGEKVYVSIESNELNFDGIFEIIEIVSTNFIIIDKTYQALTGVSGFVNTPSRRNYKVLIRLNISGTLTTIRDFVPNNKGVARCYLNSILIDYFSKLPEFDYTELIQSVKDYVISFQILKKEEWIGSDEKGDAITGSWRAVNAVQQLNNDNRMILREVYYESGSVKSEADFLTAFQEPVFYIGFPFTVSALIGNSTLNINRVIEDPSGSKDEELIPIGNFNKVNAFTLNSVNAQEPFVKLYIETTGGSTQGNYAEDYATNYFSTS